MQLIKKVTEIIRRKGVLEKNLIIFREESRKKRDAHNNASEICLAEKNNENCCIHWHSQKEIDNSWKNQQF